MVKVTIAWLLLLCSNVVWAHCSRTLSVIREASPAEFNADILERVSAIFAHANCPIQFKTVTGNMHRTHRMLAEGQLDVLIEASYREERQSYARFSLPYRVEKTYLFSLSQNVDKYQIRHVSDLVDKPWRIIDQGKAWFGPDWESLRSALAETGRLIDFRTGEEVIRDLKLHRAELVIATDLTRHTYLTEKNGVQPLPLLIHEEPVRIMFSRLAVSEVDVEAINQAIRVLHPDIASMASQPMVETTSVTSETD